MLTDLFAPRTVYGPQRILKPSGGFHFTKSSVTFSAFSGFRALDRLNKFSPVFYFIKSSSKNNSKAVFSLDPS